MLQFQGMIAEYERAQIAERHKTISDLMVAPIRYRIAAHLSVDKFAHLVEISPRQILRYESQAYENSSITNFKKILERINIKLKGKIESV